MPAGSSGSSTHDASARRARLPFLGPRSLGWVALACITLGARSASAQPAEDPAKKQHAHEAYERATKAADAGNYADASKGFAEADELSPNTVALESAIDTSVLADDPVLGEELLDRADHRAPPGGGVAPDKLRAAHAKFDGRAGIIRFSCDGACETKVDGAVTPKRTLWAKVGPHHVSIHDGDATLEQDVTVDATRPLALHATKPLNNATPTPVPVESPHRIVPVVVPIIGAGLTVALGVGLVASALDAQAKHDDYLAVLKSGTAAQVTQAASDGKSTELRTNVLIGVTSVVGAATVALGVLAIPFGSSKPAAASTGSTSRLGAPHDMRLVVSSTGASLVGRF